MTKEKKIIPSTVQPRMMTITLRTNDTQNLVVNHTSQNIHPKVPSHSRFTHDHLIAMLAIHLHWSSHHSLTTQPLHSKLNRQLPVPLRLLFLSPLLLLRFLLLPLLLHDATKRLLLLKQAPIYSSPHLPPLSLFIVPLTLALNAIASFSTFSEGTSIHHFTHSDTLSIVTL